MFNQDTLAALLVVAFAIFVTIALLCHIAALGYSKRYPLAFYVSLLGALFFEILGLLVLAGLGLLGADMRLGILIVMLTLLLHLVIVGQEISYRK